MSRNIPHSPELYVEIRQKGFPARPTIHAQRRVFSWLHWVSHIDNPPVINIIVCINCLPLCVFENPTANAFVGNFAANSFVGYKFALLAQFQSLP